MRDPEDIVEIAGLHVPRPRRGGVSAIGPARPWKSVWFRCCHAYGRIYRNRTHTQYVGNCPRCGARVRALIGPHGTNRTMFEAI